MAIRQFRFSILVVMIGVLSAQGPVHAQQSVESLDQAVSQLINRNRIGEARAMMEQAGPSEADRLFFEGRVLKHQGRFAEAVDAFRDVLQADPTRINARRELAHTLLLDKQYDAAEFHFRELLAIDTNFRMRDGYRQFLRVIDENKPWGVSGFLSVLPSTNVNRGTTNATFDTVLGTFVIDPTSQAESGIGARTGLQGYFRYPIDQTSRVTLDWAASGTFYRNEDFNSALGSVSISYEKIYEGGRWKLTPYTRYNWRKDEADHYATGLGLSVSQRVTDSDAIGVSVTNERRRFPNQAFRDGWYNAISIGARHQFDPSFGAGAGVGTELSTPETRHLAYFGYRLFAGIDKDWEGGFTTRLAGNVGRRDFLDDFPLTTAPRRDDYFSISFSTYTSQLDLQGFTPRLHCEWTQNWSTVDLYDYDTAECQITLTREF